ncbi:TPA: DUF1934 domain-containing protein [Streptococcus equi subsp. zooepidemicus]|uniref:DUF1934 domain-containing protein n=1 Tax=Streptococcus equi TaxID=1336 RepID=UPI0005B7357A|nr:DUF1934 domain-containing protein [Streptococcus equi]KIQ76472.1 50S ribosomal protein L19 [Streptococcus equi subsp. zooepidemicus]MCD3423325.1 DUF1934 domain-containing protein [Streptococcus equi subsp. zooepidemicus]HEL0026720.1 DUF1934 domain-containing protein [Streptococcus equi subsp. zooepidemicus]HEL0734261.1 DUF1934 domain-containing protein [Streptococcus equi subsp. zooepidemicus]HEL1058402.1 DUF1934 domain-containing protein [Streptococcus equi subsp. zooepidemicus]
MKIEINNKISYGQEIELIKEIHTGDLRQKADATYLIYQNNDNERVVIKFNAAELTMSRFSKPQSVMRFLANKKALIAIPTPVGIQQFLTDTSHFHLDHDQQTVTLDYALLQASTETAFAHYHLEIKWY